MACPLAGAPEEDEEWHLFKCAKGLSSSSGWGPLFMAPFSLNTLQAVRVRLLEIRGLELARATSHNLRYCLLGAVRGANTG